MKLLRFWLLLTVGLLTATCRTPDPEAPHPGCSKVLRYELDPRFTDDQMSVALKALDAWDRGTGGGVCFTQGIGGIRIEKVDSQPMQGWVEKVGAEYNDVEPKTIVGLAWYPAAYIITSKLDSEYDLYATIIHEVGHLLGMEHYHGPEPSWMYPSIVMSPHGDWSLTLRDERVFCESNKCGKRGAPIQPL